VKSATCHPDRKHWVKGLCRRCYQRAWFEDFAHAARCARLGVK
jgi:hypothetical protein